ncbi:L,D-transpeptidase family protein, partial [Shewanella sp. 0m-11]
MRFCSYLCCFTLYCVTFVSVADERLTRAQNMLYQQVSLMALVDSESKFDQYKQLLSQPDLSQSELQPI